MDTQQTIIEIRPNGDPFGRGYEGIQSEDGGGKWFYRGDIGARPRAWWRVYARRQRAVLRYRQWG